MSELLKLLGLEPINEDIVKSIVQAVGIAAAKVDLAALGTDLAVLRMSVHSREMPSSRNVSASKRKVHAGSVRQHAKKLLDVLSTTGENDERSEFWQLIFSQHDAALPNLIARVKVFDQFLLLLIRDADQIISMANGKIHSTKETEKLFGSSPGLAKLRDLWNSPRSVSWIIAWELAPIFKRHFGRRATASMPSEASGVRTPQGPFVRFVQSVQQNLKLFPGQESVPPHTIDSALRKSKTQRDEQARADARVGPLLQGDLQRKI